MGEPKDIISIALSAYSKDELRAMYKRGVKSINFPVGVHGRKFTIHNFTVIELLNAN